MVCTIQVHATGSIFILKTIFLNANNNVLYKTQQLTQISKSSLKMVNDPLNFDNVELKYFYRIFYQYFITSTCHVDKTRTDSCGFFNHDCRNGFRTIAPDATCWKS